MALGFDAATGANINGGAASTTFAHTCTGSDRALFVIICQWQGNANAVLTGVTYNAVALTQVGQSGLSASNDRTTIYRLIAPATGANNVVVSTVGNPSGSSAGRLYAMSFTGADQTDPDGTATTATGSSTAPTISPAASAGDWMIDGLTFDASSATATMTADAGRTQRGNAASGGEAGCVSEDQSPGTPTETMNWTLSVSSTWAMAGLAVKAAAVANPLWWSPSDVAPQHTRERTLVSVF